MLSFLMMFACVNRDAPAFAWIWSDEAPLAGLPDLVPGKVVGVFAGDAGKHHPHGAMVDGPCTAPEDDAVVLSMMRDVDPDSAVFWLGDNVYDKGWEPGTPIGSCDDGDDDAPAKGMAALRRQIAAAPDPSQAWFVPGNHDYAQGGLGQHDRIRAQAEFVGSEGANMLAVDSPIEAVRLDGVTVVAYDSQRAVLESDDQNDIVEGMDALVEKASARGDDVVIIAHHPLFTVGPHGFAGVRGFFTSTDQSNRKYARWRQRLKNAIVGWEGKVDVTVAGHEHSLQLFDHSETLHVVAGSASKTSAVRGMESEGVRLTHAESSLGYMLLTEYEGAHAIELIAVRRTEGPGCTELTDGWYRCRAAHAWIDPAPTPSEAPPPTPSIVEE